MPFLISERQTEVLSIFLCGSGTLNIPYAGGMIFSRTAIEADCCCCAPLFIYLGQSRMALYLMHETILFAKFLLLHGLVVPWVLATIYLLVAFGVAHLSYRYVETLNASSELLTAKYFSFSRLLK